MAFKKLDGTDVPDKYSVIDDFNRQGDVGRSIVAMFEIDPDDGKWTATGTGFFVAKDILITARHVFEHKFSLKRSYAWDGSDPDAKEAAQVFRHVIVQQSADGTHEIRQVIRSVMSARADICMVKVEPAKVAGQPCLPLTGKLPQVGDTVFTYAFPESTIVEDGKKREVWLNGGFYRGIVHEVSLSGIGTMTPWQNFRVDFHIHGGASGGPVFNRSGRIVGINCTSFDGQTDLSFVTSISSDRELGFDDQDDLKKGNVHLTINELIKAGDAKTPPWKHNMS
jgi:hypothetical protein